MLCVGGVSDFSSAFGVDCIPFVTSPLFGFCLVSGLGRFTLVSSFAVSLFASFRSFAVGGAGGFYGFAGSVCSYGLIDGDGASLVLFGW